MEKPEEGHAPPILPPHPPPHGPSRIRTSAVTCAGSRGPRLGSQGRGSRRRATAPKSRAESTRRERGLELHGPLLIVRALPNAASTERPKREMRDQVSTLTDCLPSPNPHR